MTDIGIKVYFLFERRKSSAHKWILVHGYNGLVPKTIEETCKVCFTPSIWNQRQADAQGMHLLASLISAAKTNYDELPFLAHLDQFRAKTPTLCCVRINDGRVANVSEKATALLLEFTSRKATVSKSSLTLHELFQFVDDLEQQPEEKRNHTIFRLIFQHMQLKLCSLKYPEVRVHFITTFELQPTPEKIIESTNAVDEIINVEDIQEDEEEKEEQRIILSSSSYLDFRLAQVYVPERRCSPLSSSSPPFKEEEEEAKRKAEEKRKSDELINQRMEKAIRDEEDRLKRKREEERLLREAQEREREKRDREEREREEREEREREEKEQVRLFKLWLLQEEQEQLKEEQQKRKEAEEKQRKEDEKHHLLQVAQEEERCKRLAEERKQQLKFEQERRRQQMFEQEAREKKRIQEMEDARKRQEQQRFEEEKRQEREIRILEEQRLVEKQRREQEAERERQRIDAERNEIERLEREAQLTGGARRELSIADVYDFSGDGWDIENLEFSTKFDDMYLIPTEKVVEPTDSIPKAFSLLPKNVILAISDVKEETRNVTRWMQRKLCAIYPENKYSLCFISQNFSEFDCASVQQFVTQKQTKNEWAVIGVECEFSPVDPLSRECTTLLNEFDARTSLLILELINMPNTTVVFETTKPFNHVWCWKYNLINTPTSQWFAKASSKDQNDLMLQRQAHSTAMIRLVTSASNQAAAIVRCTNQSTMQKETYFDLVVLGCQANCNETQSLFNFIDEQCMQKLQNQRWKKRISQLDFGDGLAIPISRRFNDNQYDLCSVEETDRQISLAGASGALLNNVRPVFRANLTTPFMQKIPTPSSYAFTANGINVDYQFGDPCILKNINSK